MSDRLLRMDMHLHTYRSFDSLNRPKDILSAASRLGLDRLVVTDHNEIRGALELEELDPERVIVGEEIKTAEGADLIGILVRDLIPKGTPAREAAMRIREQGGVVYLPHPFDGSRSGSPAFLESIADLVDVVEIHNARCFPTSLNERARRWAEKRGKLMGSGSDAHTIRELGRGYVEVPEFRRERESYLEALARGRVAGVASTSPAYRLASSWAKIRKALPGGRVP